MDRPPNDKDRANKLDGFSQGAGLAVFMVIVLFFTFLTLEGGGVDDHLVVNALFYLMGFVQFPFLMVTSIILLIFKKEQMAKGMMMVSGGYFLLSGLCAAVVAAVSI
ncbi:MAG: hypothetical protein ACPG31_00610 [Planctomycetota bacterium]